MPLISSGLEHSVVHLDLSNLQTAPPLGDLLKLHPPFLTPGRNLIPESLGHNSQQRPSQCNVFIVNTPLVPLDWEPSIQGPPVPCLI